MNGDSLSQQPTQAVTLPYHLQRQVQESLALRGLSDVATQPPPVVMETQPDSSGDLKIDNDGNDEFAVPVITPYHKRTNGNLQNASHGINMESPETPLMAGADEEDTQPVMLPSALRGHTPWKSDRLESAFYNDSPIANDDEASPDPPTGLLGMADSIADFRQHKVARLTQLKIFELANQRQAESSIVQDSQPSSDSNNPHQLSIDATPLGMRNNAEDRHSPTFSDDGQDDDEKVIRSDDEEGSPKKRSAIDSSPIGTPVGRRWKIPRLTSSGLGLTPEIKIAAEDDNNNSKGEETKDRRKGIELDDEGLAEDEAFNPITNELSWVLWDRQLWVGWYLRTEPNGKYLTAFSDGTVATVLPERVMPLIITPGDVVKVRDEKMMYKVIGVDRKDGKYGTVELMPTGRHSDGIVKKISIDIIYMGAPQTTKVLKKIKIESTQRVTGSQSKKRGLARADSSLKALPLAGAANVVTTATSKQTGRASSTVGSSDHSNSNYRNQQSSLLKTSLKPSLADSSLLFQHGTGVSSTIFAGCVFAVTSDNVKQDLAKTIEVHGGTVAHSGLREMFEVNDNKLSPKEVLKNYTFGAVIAKDTLRTPKFLEGLALGWPCLSERFIFQCVKAGELLKDNWLSYLLPSGVSTLLGGVSVSYNITDYYLSSLLRKTTLHEQFYSRNRFLANLGQVGLVSRNGEEAAVFSFLLLAMGCESVEVIDKNIKGYDNGENAEDEDEEDEESSHSSITTLSHKTMVYSAKDVDGKVPHGRSWVIQCAVNRQHIL